MEMESVIESKSEQLLLKAHHFGAADIHLMPEEHQYSVCFRKYGQLIPAGMMTDDIAQRLISYFKFLSSLDIGERRKPQSGAFCQSIEEVPYAFRVSTLPSSYSKESLAIRLLRQNYAIPLKALCYRPAQAEVLTSFIESRQGLLLFCGATGSGKTTTLYSLIRYGSTVLSRHVISLEDPVESNQAQILQVQVNERAGITYASGLKAILRHSPDIIMIGEIRDRETAHIALEAALTGHLVVATIHAKDAVNCLYRLIDFGLSLDELRQVLLAVASQLLIEVAEDEQKALFELLAGAQLKEALQAISKNEFFELPVASTLQGQLAQLKVGHYVPRSS